MAIRAPLVGSWPAFTYKDYYVIWGLTHRILTQLWASITLPRTGYAGN